MDFSAYRIPNRVKEVSIRPNSLLDSSTVDSLLNEYSSLIDVRYTSWFASRFMYMSAEGVARCASEATADGKDPKRLFAFLIRKRSA